MPIIVACGYAVADHWAPIGDDAFIGLRAYDVFTGRSPLVGQRSSGASGVLEKTTYSPGPLLFWLLAIPVRLPDPIFMTLTTGAVNVASVVSTVGLAFRRGGRVLMFATAAAIPIMLASLPAETYADVWNSSAPLMPLMLLVFLAWSVACGEYRLLPLTVLVASFAAQSHLTFVGPALALTLVALACAVAFGSARKWPRRWVGGTLVVAVLCWSAPLLDQAIHRPGNFVALARSASSDEPSLGFGAGWKAVAHTIGVPPWWLQDDRLALQRIGDISVRPGAPAIVSALLVLAGLAAVAAIGARRARADVVAAGLLGITLCVAIGLATSSTPDSSFATVVYTLRWTSPAGMCVWLMLGWAAVTLVPRRVPSGFHLPGWAGVASVSTVALVGALVAIGENPPRPEPYRSMRAITGRLEAELPAEGATRVEVSSDGNAIGMANEFEVGTAFWLRRSGRAVVISREAAERLDSAYARGPYQRVVHLAVGVPPPRGGRVIARVAATDALVQITRRIITVTLGPAPPTASSRRR